MFNSDNNTRKLHIYHSIAINEIIKENRAGRMITLITGLNRDVK